MLLRAKLWGCLIEGSQPFLCCRILGLQNSGAYNHQLLLNSILVNTNYFLEYVEIEIRLCESSQRYNPEFNKYMTHIIVRQQKLTGQKQKRHSVSAHTPPDATAAIILPLQLTQRPLHVTARRLRPDLSQRVSHHFLILAIFNGAAQNAQRPAHDEIPHFSICAFHDANLF